MSAVSKFFTKILLCSLCQKCLLFSIIIKERHLYSWKNIHSTLDSCENCKSLALQIFPCLRYISGVIMAVQLLTVILLPTLDILLQY